MSKIKTRLTFAVLFVSVLAGVQSFVFADEAENKTLVMRKARINMYSGRPNPNFELSLEENEEIERIKEQLRNRIELDCDYVGEYMKELRPNWARFWGVTMREMKRGSREVKIYETFGEDILVREYDGVSSKPVRLISFYDKGGRLEDYILDVAKKRGQIKFEDWERINDYLR